VSAFKLADVQLHDIDVVGIDEGQFVSVSCLCASFIRQFVDLVDECERLANLGKVVIVAALDGDYRREAFTQIAQLIPKAEVLHKLQAVCMHCYKDAAFTKRITGETQVSCCCPDTLTATECAARVDRRHGQVHSRVSTVSSTERDDTSERCDGAQCARCESVQTATVRCGHRHPSKQRQ
jgi:hypothetical protein